jgi:hypothetical protein
LQKVHTVSFVDKLVLDIENKFHGDYRKLCIIFPTRRACLVFRKQLASLHNKPVWAPAVMAIGDFVARHITNKVGEEIPLLLALYEVYKKHWPEQDFSRFYHWGQMLINDFDEIDKQLGDPSRIFANIREIKKIDAAFMPDSESLQWIQQFVSSLNTDNISDLQKEFSYNWDRLQVIYRDFNLLLEKEGISYEGKAYRQFLTTLYKNTFETKWDTFAFAGFYGFSRAEEDMVRLIEKKKKVLLYWDADSYYINNTMHEAGYYFRKSLLASQGIFPVQTNFNSKKKIQIAGVPLNAGQAKYAGQILKQLFDAGELDIDRTAIILPDENMLFPVLYSIPSVIETVNVTMGYPLKQSQYASLLNNLYELHQHSRKRLDGEMEFHHRYVDRVLQHPLFVSLQKPTLAKTEFRSFMDAKFISEKRNFPATSILFREIKNVPDLFSYINSLFELILLNLQNTSGTISHIEDTVISFIASEIGQLFDQLSAHIEKMDLKTCWQMINECIAGLKVPFSGEPVKGLQVMGFLETRALDFKTVIFLNVNEGLLPSSSSSKSFIPYSLRKGFGLPTYEDQDASFSYHFYRLLHKSENIFLLYNTEAGKTGGGEPSRYILQVKQELKKYMGDNLELNFKTVSTPVITGQPATVIIKKNEAIMLELEKYLDNYTGEKKRSFSSSALTSYMHCNLQFYFRYLAGIKEKEEKSDSLEAGEFGEILHKALELIYQKNGSEITAEHTDELLKIAAAEVEEAFRVVYNSGIPQLEGNDILLAEVVEELVKRIIANDKKAAPFSILNLEGQFESVLSVKEKPVRLYGKFDRVDLKNGITRIIDYKTGKVELKSKSAGDLFTDPKKKGLFQLHFYALVYKLLNPSAEVTAGFYIARKLGSGISWANDGKTFSDDGLIEFAEMLSGVISEIFDKNIPFAQTAHTERCDICPYSNICHR